MQVHVRLIRHCSRRIVAKEVEKAFALKISKGTLVHKSTKRIPVHKSTKRTLVHKSTKSTSAHKSTIVTKYDA
jgi:hypothetical protein